MNTIARDRELRVRNHERDRGRIAYRLPQPSAADVLSMKAGTRPLLIQVKSTAQGPYERFVPAERRELIAEAIMAGADPILAWWPKGGSLQWFPPESWPDMRQAA